MPPPNENSVAALSAINPSINFASTQRASATIFRSRAAWQNTGRALQVAQPGSGIAFVSVPSCNTVDLPAANWGAHRPAGNRLADGEQKHVQELTDAATIITATSH